MGRVIPHLEQALKEWRRHQGRKTNYEWAFTLHRAGFMGGCDVTEVEAILDAATNSGEWMMDDPLSTANEFITVAKHVLIHDATDSALHEAVAKALYDELFLLLDVYTLP